MFEKVRPTTLPFVVQRGRVISRESWLRQELNSVTDNPLLFFDEETGVLTDVISGGNFHGEPLAIALDYLAIVCAVDRDALKSILRQVTPTCAGYRRARVHLGAPHYAAHRRVVQRPRAAGVPGRARRGQLGFHDCTGKWVLARKSIAQGPCSRGISAGCPPAVHCRRPCDGEQG